ncbi:MAG: peptidylprolyl isomerase [Candidatus Micrarchaeota archaeon]|nr:peptidylprolyl isomerase [Candidatus Micrarchaeota archaeon]MDE1847064.1 peptidylprolyl isomerase [Candidatus Micrarchaeota archaeon]
MALSTKKVALGVVLAIVIVVIAALLITNVLGAQVVANGDTVSVEYTGSLSNGTVFDSNVGGAPFNFTVGANQVIPGFDSAIRGMHKGQNKTFTIPFMQAYGPINASLIVSVPVNAFGNQTVHPGMQVGTTEQNGQQMRGIVEAVNATTATVNFNPPLAGQNLTFSIKVLAIYQTKQ